MPRSGPDPRIIWIVHDLHQRIAAPSSTVELARRVGLSPSRFRALFTAQMGFTPDEYVQRLRVRRARLLIERTFLRVEEIMTLVGYDDLVQFVRDFRHEHGTAPDAIRRTGIVTPCLGPGELNHDFSSCCPYNVNISSADGG